MKKSLQLLIAFCLMATLPAAAQRASEVLENGIKVRSNEEVFLKFDGTHIKYQHNTVPGLHFRQVKDSAILLPVEESLLLYIRPLNPLNYSFKGENKIIIDPIDEAAATALTSIVDFLKQSDLNQINMAKTDTTIANLNLSVVKTTGGSLCAFEGDLVASYNNLLIYLQQDRKQEIVKVFANLKQLSFETESETKEGLQKAEEDTTAIGAYFRKAERDLSSLKKQAETLSCDDPILNFVTKQVFAEAIKDLEVTLSNQKKRFTNLGQALALVKEAQTDASRNGWLVAVQEVPADRGKISVFTLRVNEGGYRLSDAGEIVEAETKEKAGKVLRVRRFQALVPEVSVGIAYTNLRFPKYSTIVNTAGKHVVAQAGEDTISKVNFSTMINYTLFLKNSPVHPFWQIGIGVNKDFPTLLSGVGLRINANGVRRLALSYGLATTWIKTLDGIALNQEVEGPAVVEQNTKYKLKKPRTYFGIQYNF